MKLIWSLGISGTLKGDGVKVSFIRTDGLKLKDIGPDLFLPYPEALKFKILHARNILSRLVSQYNHFGLTAARQRVTVPARLDPSLLDVARESSDWSIQAAKILIQQSHISPALIGFNGQPVFTLHKNNIQQAVTYENNIQQQLSDIFNCPVVYDFGSLDFAYAESEDPLLGIYYQALLQFSGEQSLMQNNTAIIDINAITNVTILKDNQKAISFDAGPGSILVDEFIQRNFQKDNDFLGSMAQKGSIITSTIHAWLKDIFLQKSPSKYLDIESYWKFLNSCQYLLPVDSVATLTALTVEMILYGLKPYKDIKNLILLGTNAHNRFINTMLSRHFKIIHPESIGWNPPFLESQQYAYYAANALHTLSFQEEKKHTQINQLLSA